MDYRATYDEYWNREDRQGESSFGCVSTVAEEIQRCVGVGSIVDIGCGHGHLVRELNQRGFDARGVDVSNVAVDAANATSPGRFQFGSILDLPLEDASFDCVVSTDCFEHLEQADVPRALAELWRVARQDVYLRIALKEDRDDRWHLTVKDREWWETCCYEAGFRKHPRYFLASPFGCLDQQTDHCTIVLSKIKDKALERYPLAALLAERQLHTDMSREAGRRSDAHNMRYFEAARRVRPGDRVLDIACGLGYGATQITHNSRCASYLGIDNSDYAIDYAQASFGDEAAAIRFEKGSLPECLAAREADSFDFIASFETLEHLQDPAGFLRECRRLLTPGGRLMLSVPNDWTEADGKDPNPHHFHVYTWNRILQELREEGFLIEQTVAETVSRRKEDGAWATHGYEWREHEVRSVETAAGEWCILLAMKSPFENTKAAFTNSAFAEAVGQSSNVMDFSNQYENPWLVRSLITRGLRTERAALQHELADEVLGRSQRSADRGAALCVKAYVQLGGESAWSESEPVVEACERYAGSVDVGAGPPIEVRWAVSLAYAGGLLAMRSGQRDRAKRLLQQAVDLPFMRYSPVLGTKTVGAALLLARLAVADRLNDEARTWFRRGLELSQQAVTADWSANYGDLARQPLPLFKELAEVLELGGQCAAGLALLEIDMPAPVFWEQIGASKSAEVERLTSEITSLNEQSQKAGEVLAWHQQQLSTWHGAYEHWRAQAEHWQGVAESPHPSLQHWNDQAALWRDLVEQSKIEIDQLRGMLEQQQASQQHWNAQAALWRDLVEKAYAENEHLRAEADRPRGTLGHLKQSLRRRVDSARAKWMRRPHRLDSTKAKASEEATLHKE
ncbi:putative S-adenosylmethionine-dependent methyltransferase [Botrimarina hoheduenensis]|uniref:Putative S-adenosylmethionine-dependent methyltransferase n=2 Tax=Botrimarina hoheduenensis TaxID=2528000 RepID=A0A5C5VX85_9BACT|nr:putative S-adenosylmethionine-dependent methyltransferase [Botrimarina hoheduenensis]